MSWFKRLLCEHYYEIEVPWKQYNLYIGLTNWYCIYCGKTITKKSTWTPIERL